MEITCPSGLKGRIRGFKVKDEQILADPNLVRDGRVISKLLSACWLETIDPGPYTFLANGEEYKKPDWGKILQGDRLFTLVQIRVKSYGPEYEFDVPCSNNACSQTIQWRMNLPDLELRELPEESRDKFRRGEPFETYLPDEKKVQYRLLVGDDDRYMARLRENNPSKLLLGMLTRRIVEIEGIGSDPRKIKTFIEDMEAGDADRLRDELEESDCGLETQFDVYCTGCNYDQPVILPLEMSFFSSRRRFSRSRRRAGES